MLHILYLATFLKFLSFKNHCFRSKLGPYIELTYQTVYITDNGRRGVHRGTVPITEVGCTTMRTHGYVSSSQLRYRSLLWTNLEKNIWRRILYVIQFKKKLTETHVIIICRKKQHLNYSWCQTEHIYDSAQSMYWLR